MTDDNQQITSLTQQTAAHLISRMAKDARTAQHILGQSDNAARNAALSAAAAAIRASEPEILIANQRDRARGADAGLTDAFIDRLTLTPESIEAMAQGLDVIAQLDDPLGAELARWTVSSGLDIARIATALGVIGVIYESRPNVTVDAASLCIKSGNAALLRCGSVSQHTSSLLASLMQSGLKEAGLPQASIQIMPTTDRHAVGAMLAAAGEIDVIIPRGGKGLVGRVQQEARVPVFAHLEGICHLYVAPGAKCQMAVDIAVNAKMRRVGICGAAETILIDKVVADSHSMPIVSALIEAGCEVRGDAVIAACDSRVIAATDDDFGQEFEAPIIAIKIVDNMEHAMRHISQFGSGHTESIITSDEKEAEAFLTHVDSAIVMHNASTQFADGGEFGMGAEIGIATGRLHARGPVGVQQLTSFKYIVRGNGHKRA